MIYINKEFIANTCENPYKECLKEIPQIENNNLIWILNGSTLCNFLYNVTKINNINVSEKFNKNCYDFIRQTKGDIDITYRNDRPYKFDLKNKYIKEFQKISEEQRTYNFVDSNSELKEADFEELCKMETKNGLKFIAKKPQYLFLYKFKEFIAIFHNEILEENIETIKNKKKNIIPDVTNLYDIAIPYCGIEELNKTINKLKDISETLNKIYKEDKNKYYKIIEKALLITYKNQKKKMII